MKYFLFALLALLFAGCSKPSIAGLYQSVGSEDKFRMTLEVADGSRAKFVTRANLGKAEMDRAIEASMSINDARWSKEGAVLVVAGPQAEGKTAIYRFLIQANGDLVWDMNGARLVKVR